MKKKKTVRRHWAQTRRFIEGNRITKKKKCCCKRSVWLTTAVFPPFCCWRVSPRFLSCFCHFTKHVLRCADFSSAHLFFFFNFNCPFFLIFLSSFSQPSSIGRRLSISHPNRDSLCSIPNTHAHASHLRKKKKEGKTTFFFF